MLCSRGLPFTDQASSWTADCAGNSATNTNGQNLNTTPQSNHQLPRAESVTKGPEEPFEIQLVKPPSSPSTPA